jgi:hypothetical protein
MLAVALSGSAALAQAVPEHHYSVPSASTKLVIPSRESLFVPLPVHPDMPTYEEANPYGPCAFCSGGLDPSANPADDLPRYEEMNPDTDRVSEPDIIQGE